MIVLSSKIERKAFVQNLFFFSSIDDYKPELRKQHNRGKLRF